MVPRKRRSAEQRSSTDSVRDSGNAYDEKIGHGTSSKEPEGSYRSWRDVVNSFLTNTTVVLSWPPRDIGFIDQGPAHLRVTTQPAEEDIRE